ncbi:MAG: enoyl-CoA hydratase-related protein [Gemmobacter sp.]
MSAGAASGAAAPVLYAVRGALGVITLNRPEVANAMDAAGSAMVDGHVRAAEADPAIGAIVVTGAGDRAFCAGMDLREAALRGAGHGLIPGAGFCGLTERAIAKPVIAAVNGAAVAGGFEIALACDLVVADEGTVFALPEIRRGMVAFTGGVQRLARILPRAAAMEIILTGAPVPAERLAALGVITRVVPRGTALAAACALGDAMLANSWAAIAGARSLFDHACDVTLAASIAHAHARRDTLLGSADSREGIAAYVEGRDAIFGKDQP